MEKRLFRMNKPALCNKNHMPFMHGDLQRMMLVSVSRPLSLELVEVLLQGANHSLASSPVTSRCWDDHILLRGTPV